MCSQRIDLLSQQIFELNSGVGLGVAVLDDHRGIDGDSPILAGPAGNGPGTGNDHGALGNYQRFFLGGAVDGVAHQIVHRGGAIEDGAGAQHGAALHHGGRPAERVGVPLYRALAVRRTRP